MRAQLKLGRIAGISIGLHYSWFIIALLITLSLADQFHRESPQWGEPVVWAAASITGLLFFTALLLHELAHSIIAKSRGLRVRAITLFALGGVSQIESESPDARTEFWIAIAGPLTSIIIGLIFLFLARLAGGVTGIEGRSPTAAVLHWLGYINIALAGFNMIPGYPLDGGRVLRAVTWWITRDIRRSTRLASQVGQAVAFIFILIGIYQFFKIGIGGLWLAFIGWFLLDAARSSYIQLELTQALRGKRVADVMERSCATVEAHLSLQDFVNEYLLRTGSRCFIVVQNNAVVGLITPNEVKKVPRDQWPQASVQSAMRPLRDLRVVAPDTLAVQALEIMTRDDINQLPVLSDGQLQGVFSRGQVLRLLQTYAELHGH